jgi:hypothetical protein
LAALSEHSDTTRLCAACKSRAADTVFVPPTCAKSFEGERQHDKSAARKDRALFLRPGRRRIITGDYAVKDNSPAPHAQDWATTVATTILLEVRQAALAAITNELSSIALRNRVARLLRDEITIREQELYAQIRNQTS